MGFFIALKLKNLNPLISGVHRFLRNGNVAVGRYRMFFSIFTPDSLYPDLGLNSTHDLLMSVVESRGNQNEQEKCEIIKLLLDITPRLNPNVTGSP